MQWFRMKWVLVGVDISTYDPADGTPGFLLHGNPLYGGRPGAFFAFEPASILIGVMRSEHPRFQAWWADSAADIAVAKAALKQCCESWDSVALRSTTGGAPFSVREDIEIRRRVKRGQSLAWPTLEQSIMKGLSTAGVISGGHAERVWRDATTIHTHLATLNNDFKGLEYAALVFGVEEEVVAH